ncbi:putative alcohol dehydrogenase [Lasiosphaeria hispida]|uniref:Alcohol dehydrogenase n=1 Tax=Lasiosphaeria hispida TaxID=260671 RepID=A0AAJ0MAR9_9PEZI|nr:putative alcohol dehydrogenase [Lasiosphaeria hispida]
MATTQRALLLTKIGEPLILVQLRVAVAGINPHDYKARDTGLFVSNSLPAVLTNDVVGRVTELGEGVAGLVIGDRVVSQAGITPGSSQNGLQEYAVADVGAMAKIPDGITDDEAATLPINIIAPVVGLFGSLAIPAPWSPDAAGFDYASTALLIIGGGSNCGKFAVQLAKLAGIGTIVVVGGAEAALKEMGATHVVDRHGGHDAVLGRVREVVGDDLVYAFDAVNPPGDQILAIDALSSKKRGAMARLLPNAPVDESRVAGKTAGFDVRDVFGMSQMHPGLAGPFWDLLPGYLEEGRIKPLEYTVVKGLEADHVNAVLDRYRDGERVAKTHVHL